MLANLNGILDVDLEMINQLAQSLKKPARIS